MGTGEDAQPGVAVQPRDVRHGGRSGEFICAGGGPLISLAGEADAPGARRGGGGAADKPCRRGGCAGVAPRERDGGGAATAMADYLFVPQSVLNRWSEQG